MAKKKPAKAKVTNRKARHDYELGDSLVVGLELTGAETKSLRMGHGILRGSHVNVLNNELWLIGAQIVGSNGVPISEDQQTRSRRLLAKRKEIDKLIAERKAGKTIVPLDILAGGRYIKLRISVGRGKKHYDKRETLKKRSQQRDIERQVRQ
jgi:SsrA-binding protein